MKYVLARDSHSAGRHYHYHGNFLLSSTFIEGTPILSDALIYDTQAEAEEVLHDDKRLLFNHYFVCFIEDKELFEARLKDT